MKAPRNPGEFDELDAYVRAADAEALAALAARIDVERHLQQLLQDAGHPQQEAQEPGHKDN